MASTVKTLKAANRDQIFTTVMEVVREDLAGKTGAEEFYQSSQWQPGALEAVMAELFDNKQLLAIINY
jgi:Zn-dependent alcohol dehydrogenase